MSPSTKRQAEMYTPKRRKIFVEVVFYLLSISIDFLHSFDSDTGTLLQPSIDNPIDNPAFISCIETVDLQNTMKAHNYYKPKHSILMLH